MKKIKQYIIISIFIMILFLLITSMMYKVSAAITGAPGVGYPDSLIGNHCCQENTALWSPNIEQNYKSNPFTSELSKYSNREPVVTAPQPETPTRSPETRTR